MSKKNERVVTLQDLWELLISHIWIFILIGIAAMAATAVISRVIVEPKYQSRATLYILRQDNEPNYIYTQSDFSLAKDVVNDCTYVIKSEEVLNEVIQKLKLDCSVYQLQRSITTNNPDNTRFLEVYVESDSPKAAKQTVDAICDIASKKIAESMGFDQVNLYAYGDQPSGRSNGTGLIQIAFIGLIAAAVGYLMVLIRFLTDTRIQTTEDITKYLNISVLAEVPNSQTGKGGSSQRKRYQYANQYRSDSGRSKRSQEGGKGKK